MTWSLLALLGGGLSLAAALLGARRGRPLAALMIALLALIVWARAGFSVDLPTPASAGGVAVTTTLTLQRPGGAPQLRQLPLERAIPYGGLALLGLAFGGLLATFGRRQPKRAYTGLMVIAVGVASLTYAREGGGEAEVRALLSALDPAAAHLASFSVPSGAWRYPFADAPILWIAAGVALTLALSAWRRLPLGALRVLGPLLAAGALCGALLSGAPQVGQLGPQWIAALMLGLGALEPRHHPPLAVGAVALLALTGGF